MDRNSFHGHAHDDEAGSDDESRASDASTGEVTSMVLKEQLSSIRDLNPGFQCMWEKATTEFKVSGGICDDLLPCLVRPYMSLLSMSAPTT